MASRVGSAVLHILDVSSPGSEGMCACQVRLLGHALGPPSALICGDNSNVGKERQLKSRDELHAATGPIPRWPGGEVLKRRVSRVFTWGKRAAEWAGVWDCPSPQQLFQLFSNLGAVYR